MLDISIRFSSSEETPIFMIRLVAESGGIIHGGLAQVGRVGVTWAMRSCTSCRALTSSVPRSKISSIAESWETDFERSSSRPGTPVSCSSIGIVIELLDLVRGVAERDRLDLDARWRELGEDVDLRARNLRDAEGHQSPWRRTAPATGTAGFGR